MELSYRTFELVEDVAVCLYSLCENGLEHLDCVPTSVNAILELANLLGIEISLAEILSRNMPPITELSEYEAQELVDRLRKAVREKRNLKNVLTTIYSTLVNAVTLQNSRNKAIETTTLDAEALAET